MKAAAEGESWEFEKKGCANGKGKGKAREDDGDMFEITDMKKEKCGKGVDVNDEVFDGDDEKHFASRLSA